MEESEAALVKYADRVYEDYAAAPSRAWVVGGKCGDFAEKVNMAELLEKIEQETGKYFDEGK